MSEEGGFIDVESDEVPELGGEATATSSGQNSNDPLEYHTDKRAHHNLLERRRRDHIKDSFHGLRDCIPSLQGEKVSRAHILNKATEYIRQMQRGGSMRENEITDLKKKNEVLEEQVLNVTPSLPVRAIEQSKAVGSDQKIEEVLESVAKQVQQKQQQRESCQDKAVQGGGKSDKPTIDLSRRDLAHSFTMATRATPTTVGSGADPKKLDSTTSTQSATTTSALNLLHLAGNLKNAQALLSVLQKNLPPNATLANVKTLASKALSLPARQGQTNASASSTIPRGIVTATTVPKGSALPPNLASALQQKTTGTSPVLVGGKVSQLANHLTSQLKPTTGTPIQPSGSVAALVKTGQTIPETGSTSLPSQGDNGLVQGSNKSTATQVLEASTLLQQQGGGDVGGASGTVSSLTAELIAQCFLNLPNNNSSSVASVSGGSGNEDGDEEIESVAMTTDATVSAANVLAALGNLSQALTSNSSHPPTFTSSPLTPTPVSSSATPTNQTENSNEATQETPPVAKKPKLEHQL
jgi:hypothetical protein